MGLGASRRQSVSAFQNIQRSMSFARTSSPEDDAEHDPALALQMYTVSLRTLLLGLARRLRLLVSIVQ